MRFGFLARFATLFSGTLAAQVLQIAALPLLSRLFGPEEFGRYGAFGAFLLIAGLSVTARYELAVVLPRSHRIADELVVTCMWLSAVMATLTLGLGLGAVRLGWAKVPLKWAAYLALSAFFVGVFNTLMARSMRHHQYRAIAVARLAQVGSSVAASVACALSGFLQDGLLVGNLAGYAVGCAAIGWGTGAGCLVRRPVPRRAALILRRYSSFAAYNWPQAVMDGMRPLGVVASLQYFFGSATTGLYHIANQALQTPTLALAQSISQAYYRELADAPGGTRVRLITSRLIAALAAASGLGILVIWLFGARLLDIWLGESWAGVHGVMMRLVPLVVVNLIVAPLVFVFHVSQRHREFLAWGAAYNIVSVGALVFAAAGGATAQNAVLAYGLLGTAVLVLLGVRSLAIVVKAGGRPPAPMGGAQPGASRSLRLRIADEQRGADA